MANRRRTKGTSLAKGPVGLIGLALLAYGITALIFGGHSFLAAPLHWGAKGMSLIVGLALGAAAVIALANGHGAVGVFAADHLTELVWGAAAALLIVLSQLPRVGGKTRTRKGDVERPRARRRVEPAL